MNGVSVVVRTELLERMMFAAKALDGDEEWKEDWMNANLLIRDTDSFIASLTVSEKGRIITVNPRLMFVLSYRGSRSPLGYHIIQVMPTLNLKDESTVQCISARTRVGGTIPCCARVQRNQLPNGNVFFEITVRVYTSASVVFALSNEGRIRQFIRPYLQPMLGLVDPRFIHEVIPNFYRLTQLEAFKSEPIGKIVLNEKNSVEEENGEKLGSVIRPSSFRCYANHLDGGAIEVRCDVSRSRGDGWMVYVFYDKHQQSDRENEEEDDVFDESLAFVCHMSDEEDNHEEEESAEEVIQAPLEESISHSTSPMPLGDLRVP